MSDQIYPNTSLGGQEPVQTTADALNIALTRKAEIETRLAELALSPAAQRRQFLAALAGIGGVAVALATLVTGIVAGINYFEELNKERKLRIEVQVNDAVAQLSSAKAADHAAAVTTLSSFISKDPKLAPRNKRIVMAVANAMPGERDFFALRSMVEFFNTVDYSALDAATKNQTAQALVSYNRALAADAKLHGQGTEPITEADREALRTLSSLTAVIARLTANGGYVADMSNLFLADASFRHVQLENVDFSNSTLAYSDFTGAELSGARFENTDIEGTNFRAARLHGSKFIYRPTFHFFARREHSRYYDVLIQYGDYNFIDQFARNIAEGEARFPNFVCADLSGATLAGIPIVFYSTGSMAYTMFVSTNLQGTVFKPVFFYIGKQPPLHIGGPFASSIRVWKGKEKTQNSVYLKMPDYDKSIPSADIIILRDPMSPATFVTDGMFEKSNWAKASIGAWMRDYIKISEQGSDSAGTDRVLDKKYCSGW